jgi:hypothetical protein
VSDGEVWQFTPSENVQLDTELQMTTEQAWRLLTNNFDEDIHGNLRASGDHEIIGTLMHTRAVIGTPR